MDVTDENFTNKESLVELDDGRILSNSASGFHFLRYDAETGEKYHEMITYTELGIETIFNKLYKGKDGKIYGTANGLYELRINEESNIEFELIARGNESWHFYQIENDEFIFSFSGIQNALSFRQH